MIYGICWEWLYKEIEGLSMQNDNEVIDIRQGCKVDFIRECAWLAYWMKGVNG